MQNINRKMHESLMYIIKQKLGNDEVWLLPALQINSDETMRQVFHIFIYCSSLFPQQWDPILSQVAYAM